MIRVLRLIEYTYADPERMTKDMARWTHKFESRAGSASPMRMRSVTLAPVVVDELERDE